MKTTKNVAAPLQLYCYLFGHNYKVTKNVTSYVKEYTCGCCKKQLTTNSNGDLTELTPKFKEINSILEEMYSRRLERSGAHVFNASAY
ncbi:hypothetical protein ES711_06965 [Gelidibacter salicanalis]|uniref:Uncharacterized protein n=1 Tax=Gelidibacter salicanalis TaxID=291193 RepID=A0A5C7AJY8_9FLAO|nr:hypothetical protein [Gelidibacter salicanalis]TXE08244.1 hypothetical protein ES711_06965 [Gelidibacter salicanalis]